MEYFHNNLSRVQLKLIFSQWILISRPIITHFRQCDSLMHICTQNMWALHYQFLRWGRCHPYTGGCVFPLANRQIGNSLPGYLIGIMPKAYTCRYLFYYVLLYLNDHIEWTVPNSTLKNILVVYNILQCKIFYFSFM